MKIKAGYNRTLFILIWLGLLAGAVFFGVLLIVYLKSIPRVCDATACRRVSGARVAEDIVGLAGLFLAQGAWRRHWERAAWLDGQRQAAARGAGRVLPIQRELRTEAPQPLQPPATLIHHMAWRSGPNIVTFSALFALTQLGFAGLLLSAEHDQQTVTLADGAGIEAILIGFLVVIFLALYTSWRQRVEVTESGLTVRRLGRSHTIRWDDARLFALADLSTYELRGERGGVRWVRARDTSAYRPTIPFDEYQRRMDGLLLLVAERTRLPLYDVSAGK